MTGATCQGLPTIITRRPALFPPLIPIVEEREDEEDQNATTAGDQVTSASPNSTIPTTTTTDESVHRRGPNIPAWKFEADDSGAFLRTVVALLTNNVHVQVMLYFEYRSF